MKTNKIYARNFLLTLMVLAGFTASCEKEDVDSTCTEEGRVIITDSPSDRGGEDEEYPIVRGIVENGSGTPISGAFVEIIEVGHTTPTDSDTTNSLGEFEVIVPAGNYFFKVTVGSTTTTTNSISITTDINVVLTI